MFNRILVVCAGNICRSPAAQFLLERYTGRQVSSAGLQALVDHDMDSTAREVATAAGLECGTHTARKLTRELCRDADLILVMENSQKEQVSRMAPEASGKTMLLGHWIDKREIPDPYKRHREVYEQVHQLLDQAAQAWAARLK